MNNLNIKNITSIGLVSILVLFLIMLLLSAYNSVDTNQATVNGNNSNRQPIIVKKLPLNTIADSFAKWDGVSETNYVMKENNGKSYIESTVALNTNTNAIDKTNSQVLGIQDTKLDNSYTLDEIKQIFYSNLSKKNIEGISIDIKEEKDNGINRIRIMVADSEGKYTDTNEVFPYEMLFEYDETGEVQTIGMPIEGEFVLFQFNGYKY